jgi:hypothetical protein
VVLRRFPFFGGFSLMATAAQIEANRENAQHSTGPKSAAGKANSCRNRFRWGFAGTFFVLSYEKREDFETLSEGLLAEHCPETVTEQLLVEKMAQHLWLSRRAQFLQDTVLLEKGISTPDLNSQLTLLLRYQTANDRGFHKCLDQLAKLRAEKRKAEIGFERQKERNRAREQAEARAEALQNRERQRAERHKLAVALAEAKLERQIQVNAALYPVNSGVSQAQKAA